MQPPVDTTVLSSDLEEFRKILDVVFTEHGIQQVARLVYLTEAWWNDTVDWADRVLSEDTDD
jgi:hypothetical protein